MVKVTVGLVSDAAVNISLGLPRTDLDCLSKICDRAVVVAFDLVDDSAANVRFCVPRRYLDCLSKVRDGLIVELVSIAWV